MYEDTDSVVVDITYDVSTEKKLLSSEYGMAVKDEET